jgi:hypothetical protein
MIRNTLTFRLVITSIAWVTLTLAIVAVLLTILFQRHIEEYFDAFMFDHIEESIAAARVNDKVHESAFRMVLANLRGRQTGCGF